MANSSVHGSGETFECYFSLNFVWQGKQRNFLSLRNPVVLSEEKYFDFIFRLFPLMLVGVVV